MRTKTHIEYIGKNDNIESFCFAIGFYRPAGSNPVYVNGMPIGDGLTYTISQNVGDMDTTRYEIVFQQEDVKTNELYVTRITPTQDGGL
jgi:hypothetical protein